jgi:hypothetical protein
MGITDYFEIVCDNPNCNTVTHYTRYSNTSLLISRLRADGWAVGRGRKFCYCPKCARHYKSVGRYGVKGNAEYYGRKRDYPPPE